MPTQVIHEQGSAFWLNRQNAIGPHISLSSGTWWSQSPQCQTCSLFAGLGWESAEALCLTFLPSVVVFRYLPLSPDTLKTLLLLYVSLQSYILWNFVTFFSVITLFQTQCSKYACTKNISYLLDPTIKCHVYPWLNEQRERTNPKFG